MIISIHTQMRLVIFSFLAGALTGIIFDFYRVIRGMERIPKFIVVVEDILFWILTSIVIFIFLLYTNYAFAGAYVYFYIVLGLIIYIKLFSKILINIYATLLISIIKFLRILFNYVTYPLRLLRASLSQKNV